MQNPIKVFPDEPSARVAAIAMTGKATHSYPVVERLTSAEYRVRAYNLDTGKWDYIRE